MTEAIPEVILTPMTRCPNYPDYPTAWAIQNDRGERLEHHENCSSVPGWDPLSGPGFLCDCGPVRDEWKRLRALCGDRLDGAVEVPTVTTDHTDSGE